MADNNLTVKQYASPGIDSTVAETGVFVSGAGLHPESPAMRAAPFDWGNEAPSQNHKTERLIGTSPETQAKNAADIKTRARGRTIWGGFFHGRQEFIFQHPGGIVDTNVGADSHIAGGKGAASSFVRLHGVRGNQGMKLPVLPQETTRGGPAPFPAGGGSHDNLAAPLTTKVSGFASIFSFVGRKQRQA